MSSKKSISYALSDDDIKRLLKNKCNIVPYPSLHKYKTINELLYPYGCAVVLYETKEYYGHWVSVIDRSNKEKCRIEVFDSYGLYKPDQELNFIDKDFRGSSNQDYPYLTRLLYDSGCEIHYNNHRLQSEDPDVATCGRWSVVRIWLRDLDVDEFSELMKSDPKRDPEQVVTKLTNYVL